MCTLTYYPLADSSSFILTSSRDERADRKTDPPQKDPLGMTEAIYPKDAVGHGSWIVSNPHKTLCLLNGAHQKHLSTGNYRVSRGRILLQMMEAQDSLWQLNAIDLHQIEPFTIICIFSEGPIALYEFIWDGVQKHLSKLDPTKPKIWSSATLYNEDQKAKRHKWYSDWLNDSFQLKNTDLLQFHFAQHTTNSAENILMKRDTIQTVSVSQIEKNQHDLSFYYHDLIHDQIYQVAFNEYGHELKAQANSFGLNIVTN